MFSDSQPNRATDPSLRAIKDAPPTHDTLIIHHISDPHYGRTSGMEHPLEKYRAYASQLPENQRPNVLIVTGDLTLTGNREELREAAIHLRGAIQSTFRQHIFVVPGPHDIDWSVPNPADSFAAFRESMGSITVPGFIDRNGNVLAGPNPYFRSTADNYLVYLVNTVLPPEAAARALGKAAPEELYKLYRALWKTQARPNAIYADEERQQFLLQAQAFINRDGGFVAPADIERFTRDVEALHLDETGSQSQPGEELPIPLKILVTHHPLIAYIGQRAHPYPAALGSGPLIEAARHQGFQVALHGHTHEPHVFADYPMEHVLVNQNPLFQIGAGSLGAVRGVNSYNSLTAMRDKTTGAWSLDLRVIKLDDDADYPALHFLLSNPIKEGPTTAPTTTPTATIDRDFNYRMQIAMEQFSHDIATQPGELPPGPMRLMEDAIKEVVFKGYEVRVSLALKQKFATVGDPRLQRNGGAVLENHYISPSNDMDPFYMHPFSYPDTLAAWSLIQGESIIFPKDTRDGGKAIDYDWLNLSGKYPKILAELKRLSDLRNDDSPRAYELFIKLTNRQLHMADLFKPVPGNTQSADFSPRFTSFICIPMPFRPRDRRAPEIREIGVLNIDVVDPPMQPIGATFTPERLAMLQTISDFIMMVLLTAHALNKPVGVFAKFDD